MVNDLKDNNVTLLPDDIQSLFSTISSQRTCDNPFSPSNKYWAFLSKIDYSDGINPNNFDVLFEVIPQECGNARYPKYDVTVKVTPPVDPASLFFLHEVDIQSLKTALGASTIDEGQWFLVSLIPGESGNLVGDFFDPDIDIDKSVTVLPPDKPIPPKGNKGYYLRYSMFFCPDPTDSFSVERRKRQKQRYMPYSTSYRVGKQRRMIPKKSSNIHGGGLTLPVLPATPITSVGVMNVGQGSCNLIRDNTGEPVAYYDIGIPLPFYMQSAPNQLKVANPLYQGPIMNNTTGNLVVVLSHWDWDHWRLGRTAGLNTLDWLVPQQPIGPAAIAFWATVPAAQKNVWPVAFAGAIAVGSISVRKCTGFTINDSGLAVIVPIALPSAGPLISYMVMTGDASFVNVPLPAIVQASVSSITAVHHGSSAGNALINIPQSLGQSLGLPLAHNNLAYSYGFYINAAGLPRHPYGFPTAAAVAAYQAQGWVLNPPGPIMHTQNTAETSPNSNVASYGNYLVGSNIPYPPAPMYAGTYFSAFVKQGMDN